MGCLLQLIAGKASSFQVAFAEGRRLEAPPVKVRKQSGKPPGFDERWVLWEDLMPWSEAVSTDTGADREAQHHRFVRSSETIIEHHNQHGVSTARFQRFLQ